MEYKVRFVNPQKHYQDHRDEYLHAIDDVLTRGDLMMRQDVADFEESIAKMVGTSYAIGMNSGTDTMFFALKALGIGSGDEVITVSHTFVASMSVVVNCGAKLVLVDVGNDFLINPDLIEAEITEKTKAIIPVHFAGRPCEMDTIMEIAKKHNLIVIEDAAHAIESEYKGRKIGTIGDFTCFSFYVTKNLVTGEGGMITLNNKKLADKIKNPASM